MRFPPRWRMASTRTPFSRRPLSTMCFPLTAEDGRTWSAARRSFSNLEALPGRSQRSVLRRGGRWRCPRGGKGEDSAAASAAARQFAGWRNQATAMHVFRSRRAPDDPEKAPDGVRDPVRRDIEDAELGVCGVVLRVALVLAGAHDEVCGGPDEGARPAEHGGVGEGDEDLLEGDTGAAAPGDLRQNGDNWCVGILCYNWCVC